jgi:hypothetical protein
MLPFQCYNNSIITIGFVPFSLLKCYVNGSKWPLMIAKCYGIFFHNPFQLVLRINDPQCNHEIKCRKTSILFIDEYICNDYNKT